MGEGRPNTSIIQGVAYACIIESAILLPWHVWLRNDIDSEITRQPNEDRSSAYEQRLIEAKHMITYMTAIYTFRFFVGLFLFKKTYEVAIIFCVIIKIGILINLVSGICSVNLSWTFVIGVTTLFTIALHVIYSMLIYSQMGPLKAASWEGNTCGCETGDYTPRGTPNEASIFVIPNERDCRVTMGFAPPYTIIETNIPVEAPPSYEAVFGEQQEEFPRIEVTE